jgi:signal-transduction protein with cAMP-binding, CBS, and nucleotidyltransferase domain
MSEENKTNPEIDQLRTQVEQLTSQLIQAGANQQFLMDAITEYQSLVRSLVRLGDTLNQSVQPKK